MSWKTPTPEGVIKAFELLNETEWKLKQEKKGVSWFKGKVDYCATNAAKYTTVFDMSAPNFSALVDDDPEIEKGSDSITYKVDAMIDKRAYHGRCAKTNARRRQVFLKAPSIFVSPRDVVFKFVHPYFLNEEEKKRFKIGYPGLDVCMHVGTHDYETPEAKGYVRSVMHVYGWFAAETPEGKVEVTQCFANDQEGSMPVSVVNAMLGANIDTVVKMREVFEEEAKKVGKLPSPGPTNPEPNTESEKDATSAE